MSDVSDKPQLDRLRERVTTRGEETLGRIAQDLLENPWVNSALTAAFDARTRAAQAQEVAMDFLNLPSAAQIERLTRRVRSVSQRLEGIEEAIGRVEDGLRGSPAVGLAARLDAIEGKLAELARAAEGSGGGSEPPTVVAPGQERLRVDVPPAPPGPVAH